jgi:hypothetical protein
MRHTMVNHSERVVINTERVVFMAPSGLLRLIDKAAADRFEGRSSFIRHALAEHLGISDALGEARG